MFAQVNGIPTLILLDNNGALINKNAREVVMSDPEGNNYPWAPKTFKEVNLRVKNCIYIRPLTNA